MEVIGQLHDLTALTPEKEPSARLSRTLGGPLKQSGYGYKEKSLSFFF
jgi:hypothetical protein